MPSTHRYRAFISYSRADARWSSWLHRSLERYRVPRRLAEGGPLADGRIAPVFRDREDLATAADLSRRIEEALLASENLIVICSPQARASRWVDLEIETFKKSGRSNRIFCLIVAGDPTTPGSADDCFPPSLRVEYDSEGRCLGRAVEPIAADVRREGDGRTLALQKIIAGILNVELDRLRRRDARRRYRQMLLVTAGSLAGLVAMSVLTVLAVIASNEADRRRAQAEDLLGYMVGELRASLMPIGRLDLLKGVADKATQYFAGVPVADLTVGELLTQSEVLTHVGQIELDQLNYQNALESFFEAYDRAAALQARDPDDGDRLFNRGQAEFWLGFVYWRNGSLAEADEWLTRYRTTSEALLELDSSRDDWLREVGYAHHNLAVLAVERGELAAARQGFTFLVSVLQALRAKEDSTALRTDWADAVSWIGNVALYQGDLNEALEEYQRSAEVYRQLLAEDSEDAVAQRFYADAVSRVADVQAMRGNLSEAAQLVDDSIGVYGSLMARDPANAEWVRAAMVPGVVKVDVLLRQQRWEEARDLVDASLVTLQQLPSQDAADLEVAELEARLELMGSLVARSSGDDELALSRALSASRHMQPLIGLDRLDVPRRSLLASIYVHLAELAIPGGRVERQQELERARTLLADSVGKTPSPLLLDPWARLLSLSGLHDEAVDVRERLAAARYVPRVRWPD